MEQSVLPYGRGPQVLRILAKHGPLTMAGLRYIITPPIKKRRLADVVKRLRKRGVLYVRMHGYYQILQQANAWEKAAKMLHWEPEAFRLPHFSNLDSFDSESCAVCSVKLERLIAGAHVYRRHEVSALVWKNMRLPADRYAPKHLPDIVIFLPGDEAKPSICVAVIVENDYHNDQKILARIEHLAATRGVDGILLFGADWLFDERFYLIQRQRFISQASHRSDVGPYFFCFGLIEDLLHSPTLKLLNLKPKPILLTTWILFLIEMKTLHRRESKTEHAGMAVLNVEGAF